MGQTFNIIEVQYNTISINGKKNIAHDTIYNCTIIKVHNFGFQVTFNKPYIHDVGNDVLYITTTSAHIVMIDNIIYLE